MSRFLIDRETKEIVDRSLVRILPPLPAELQIYTRSDRLEAAHARANTREIQEARRLREDKMLAFVMGMHSRLGADAWVRVLNDSLLVVIAQDVDVGFQPSPA